MTYRWQHLRLDLNFESFFKSEMATIHSNNVKLKPQKRKLIDYESDEEEDNEMNSRKNVNNSERSDVRSRLCPYLDTINRGLLDFDFEKLCSVSLSKINCYACLVCGKYFQGLNE